MYKFITFEGGDGSGKTTQSKKFYDYLISQGKQAIWTREIGGTEVAEKIRDMVVSDELLGTTELLMILAARNEHIEQVIKPAIISGKIVVCDRFIDSTAAYQSDSEEDIEKIFHLNKILFKGFLPDKTIYMKLDPKIALERTKYRDNNNKYELRSLDFHKQVAGNYDLLSSKFPDRISIIDANDSVDEIFKKVQKALEL